MSSNKRNASCSVANCSNKLNSGIPCYRIPRNPDVNRKWLAFLGRPTTKNVTNLIICKDHFSNSDFGINGKKLPLAVPTIKAKMYQRNSITTELCEMVSSSYNNKSVPNTIETLVEPLERHMYPTLNQNVAVQVQFETESRDKNIQVHIMKEASDKSIATETLTRVAKSIQVNLFEKQHKHVGTQYTPKSDEDLALNTSMLHLIKTNNDLLKEKTELNAYKLALERLFTRDQIQCLLEKPIKCTWSAQTKSQSISVLHNVGNKGYKFLRKRGFPLPAVRTLQRSMEDFQSPPGIQYDVLNILQKQVSNLTDIQKNVVLLIDEIQIRPAAEYDAGLKIVIGNATLSGDSKATHAVVIMVPSASQKWKYILAYHLTGNSVDGHDQTKLILDCIRALGNIGLTVVSLVSDMGPNNRRSLNLMGVKVNSIERRTSFPHPLKPNESIYVVADPPHVLKNIRTALLNNKIKLPDDIVAKYDLPNDTVDIKYISELVQIQSNSELKLSPKLSYTHLNPSNYQKMRVPLAQEVLSSSIAAALETLAQVGKIDEAARTTAWFCRLMSKWFEIMKGKCKSKSLNEDRVQYLKEVLAVFERIKIGNAWKPFQTGLIMSTLSIIALDETLRSQGFSFVMSGRFNQNALESFFSCIRARGNQYPTGKGFRQRLRILLIKQLQDYVSPSILESHVKMRRSGKLPSSEKLPVVETEDGSTISTKMDHLNSLEDVFSSNTSQWQSQGDDPPVLHLPGTKSIPDIELQLLESFESFQLLEELDLLVTHMTEDNSNQGSAITAEEERSLIDCYEAYAEINSRDGNNMPTSSTNDSLCLIVDSLGITNNVNMVECRSASIDDMSVYYLAGYICLTLEKKVCQECYDSISEMGSKHTLGSAATFTANKEYGKLKYPSPLFLHFIQSCETFLKEKMLNSLDKVENPISSFSNSLHVYTQKYKYLFKECCSLKSKAILKYVRTRLHIRNKYVTTQFKRNILHYSK